MRQLAKESAELGANLFLIKYITPRGKMQSANVSREAVSMPIAFSRSCIMSCN